MFMLRVEHAVPDYEQWKHAFDSNPVGRERGGVRRYQILRAVEDPNYVMIDLEFDDAATATAFLADLRELWGRVDVMRDPKARIAETVERTDIVPA
jgi:hypothetical protein